jgi:hypothetical protein
VILTTFTARYNVTRLVYYEDTDDVWAALEREKELKGWLRSKKSSADSKDESALGGSFARLERFIVPNCHLSRRYIDPEPELPVMLRNEASSGHRSPRESVGT